MEILDLGARALAEAVQSGALSATAVLEAYWAHIQATEPQVRAFLHLDVERARARALAIDQAPSHLRRTWPLAGVPVAVKDNIVTEGMPTTAGSRILEGWRSPYTATVVARLEAAGAVVLGKTNLDEFAMGSSTEYSAYHPTVNPWDPKRVPGGSSGGSAAAVAAGMAAVALGSDTGGSIRQPAAYCGVVGLKPTYGRVSRYGLIAFASSLDQIGPIARSVEDAALALGVLAGLDPKDATSVPEPVPDYVAAIDELPSAVRIGVPEEYFGEGIDPAVREVVSAALRRMEAQGATLVPIPMPHTAYAIAAYYLIAPAEASSNLARYDGIRFGFRAGAPDLVRLYEETRARGFGVEVKRRILLGTHVLSAGYYDAYYLQAQRVRTLIRGDFERAFQVVDVVATPTTPDLPFPLGSRSEDPLRMYLSDVFTVTANLAGLPAVSVPAGFVDGLPVGLQLIGPAFSEAELLRTARLVERVAPRMRWPWQQGREGAEAR
ncbi:MAG: Asp-tRNA(Asn)/Glu-tRNA(Gln) amidotransferase subunit GatA [Firmicutes bacterium]|nr:Asp-tRNA(Asn)/Glu-tRNA(Gln) amidotransferase subunit GatA [Alicyclobacillaceae bacterium]MCL6497900.1 Asp-tRNA(Asn)/Glu-tRNA(Gln) amidotransferase subunit GatA [Bacillota bacterium]